MFTISSTWEAVATDGSTSLLQQCMRTIKLEDSKDFKFDSETMIDVGSCVQLVKPSKCSGNSCNISISPNNISLSRVLIISESKRVEVLNGISGEYKFTRSGKLLDDSDPDMIMFMIDITLEKPCHESLKLNLTGIDEKCWILAVFVFLSEDKITKYSNFPEIPGLTMQPRFDLEEMNALLKRAELSDNAKSFKTLFETFQNTASFPTLNSAEMKPFTLSDVNTQLHGNKNVHSPNTSPDLQRQSIENFNTDGKVSNIDLKEGRDFIQTELDNGTPKISEGNDKCHPQCCIKQKETIEIALKEFENRIYKKLSEIEIKQEQKLNQILDLLSCNNKAPKD